MVGRLSILQFAMPENSSLIVSSLYNMRAFAHLFKKKVFR